MRTGSLLALSRAAGPALMAGLVMACSGGGSNSGAPTGATSALSTAAPPGSTRGPTGTAGPPASGASDAPGEIPRTHERYAEHLVWAPSGDRVAVYCGAACDAFPGGAPDATARPIHPVHIVDLPGGAARTVKLDAVQTSPPGFVTFSPKGTLLLAEIASQVLVYRLSDLRWALNVGRIDTTRDTLVASPDDAYVANISRGTGLEVWDLDKNTIVSMFVRYDLVPGAITWLPSGKRVIFAGPAVPPELWGLQNKRIARLNVQQTEWTAPVVRVTSTGTVAVASGDGTVALFDGETGKALSVLRKPFKKGDPGKSAALAIAPDERSFAVATDFGDLTIFDIASKKSTERVSRGSERIQRADLAWSPDGAHLAFEQGSSVFTVTTSGAEAPDRIDDGKIVGYAADGHLVIREPDGAVAGFLGHTVNFRIRVPVNGGDVALSPDHKVVALTDGRVRLVQPEFGVTATLVLATREEKLSLVRAEGTTEADLKAVLGR